jgi:hypothetical protein
LSEVWIVNFLRPYSNLTWLRLWKVIMFKM